MQSLFTYDSIIGYIQTGLDIFFVWLIINYLIKIIKNSQRTVQIFQGVLLVIFIQFLAKVFGFSTIEWLADSVVSWGFLAIIIVFQPEIRTMLEKIGKSNALVRISTLTSGERENLVNELVRATGNLSSSKTGALISLEQSTSLNDYIDTGVRMNSLVSAELLCSIFMTTTPLHDGAVIIQGDKMSCASAYFPPTTVELPTKYGARHRAAIGISEVSDAFTIVVSEESGRVSITENGKLIQVDEAKLREHLNRIVLNQDSRRGVPGKIVRNSFNEQELLNQIEVEFKNNPNASDESNMKTFKTATFKVDDLLGKGKKEEKTIEQEVVEKTLDETALDSRIVVRKISVPKDTVTRENRNSGGKQ